MGICLILGGSPILLARARVWGYRPGGQGQRSLKAQTRDRSPLTLPSSAAATRFLAPSDNGQTAADSMWADGAGRVTALG